MELCSLTQYTHFVMLYLCSKIVILAKIYYFDTLGGNCPLPYWPLLSALLTPCTLPYWPPILCPSDIFYPTNRVIFSKQRTQTDPYFVVLVFPLASRVPRRRFLQLSHCGSILNSVHPVHTGYQLILSLPAADCFLLLFRTLRHLG